MSFARHARRISVTPSDLTRLADQNAELLDKLEKLESMMKTATGKAMARERTERLANFRQWWEQENELSQ